MTRTQKANDIPHNHPEAEAAFNEHQIPKFFGKSGHVDTAPNKTKKNGGGKGNWGLAGDELQDLPDEYTVFKARRRSNSMGHIENMYVKSKFETLDDEPVFDERIHGAVEPGVAEDGAELASTVSNSTNTSVEGEKA
ncbi:hypothetical protein HOY82DRAFT_72282 [Tuber indicum]|nr:hypothetical protein HOY82DRAFT_72282 [Tuber indicum]